jgi:HSP20 family protein
VFSAGTHSVAMCLTNSDFILLAKPHIFSFAEQGSEFWTSLPALASTTNPPASGARRETIFSDLFDFRREFDNVFHRLLAERSQSGVARNDGPAAPSPELPAIDAWTDNGGRNYHARLALPGVDPQNIRIHVKGNALSVTAERKNRGGSNDVNYLQRELGYRSFERTIALPEGIDTEKMTADYDDGVLEIDAPVAVAALSRRIEIGGATKAKTAGA